MTTKYFDEEKNEMHPICCEECASIIGFCNIADADDVVVVGIWCDECIKIAVREK